MVINLFLLASYDATNLLKIKQSELRLYCDLLTQQTYDIKNLILGFNSNITIVKEDATQLDNLLGESSRSESLLDAMPIVNSQIKLRSNDNLSQLSFKSAESTAFACSSSNKEKASTAPDGSYFSEDENVYVSSNEEADPNLEKIKVNV